MPEIPLDLDEVLEQEYFHTGGEELPSPDAELTTEDVLDFKEAAKILGKREDQVVAALKSMQNELDANSPNSPLSIREAEVTVATRRLLNGYDSAANNIKRRINRRILEDILGDALRGAEAWPEITADQIIDLDTCRAMLVALGVARSDNEVEIAHQLENFRLCVDASDDLHCPAKRFGALPRVSSNTNLLIADYASYDNEMRMKINRRILDEVFTDGLLSWRDVRLGRLYGELHKRRDAEARAALCISGGGIRSATFALGVIQGLASRGLLKRFDFLSTVSGGGYIGSWLSSWIRRHPEGVCGVEQDLAAIDSKAATDATPKLAPEAKPIRHLREYSNYLTPRLGITSGDTWAFIALYIRNLIVNLLIIVPLLAVLLAAPRVSAWSLKHIEEMRIWALVVFSNLSLIALFAYIGLARPVRHGSADSSAVPWPINQLPKSLRFVLFCLGGGAGASISISLTWAKWVSLKSVDASSANGRWMAFGMMTAGAVMIVVPCATYFYRYLTSSYAARRESIAAGPNGENTAIEWRRVGAETVSAIVAAAVAAGLYWFFANKVFDRPLDGLVPFYDESPFILAAASLVSPRLLFVCFAAPTVLFILFLQATIFVAGSGKYNEDYDREWWGRAGGWLLAGSIVWLLLSGVSIFGPLAIYQFPTIVGALGGASGLVAILLGKSAKSSAAQKSEAASGMSEKALRIVVPLFCVFLLAVISWLTTVIIQKVEHTEAPDRRMESQLESIVTRPEQVVKAHPEYRETLRTQPIPSTPLGVLASYAHLKTIETSRLWHLFWIGFVGVAAFGASFAVGVNRFSMHALYRNRLIRAYLGASRYDRDPNPLTGFDPYDNLEMYKLRPELLWSTSFRDFDAFLQDLRNAIAGNEAKVLSVKIADALQQTTRNVLIDNATVADVIERMETASKSTDATTIDLCRAAVQRVKTHLPRAAKQAKTKIEKLDAVLAAARKDLAKKKPQVHGRGVIIDTVIQDLNRILIEVSLTESAVPNACANRRRFDQEYPEWVVPMPCIDRGAGAPVRATDHRPPLHVVNTALNLVGGRNLAWQQRKAESFTISPLHSGAAGVGYRDSREYGSQLHGISLGTAVTISGAAASPNQGYHSSIPLAFLLTMFNVRLGCWLGNPGPAGQDTWGRDNPSSTVALLAREMIGETNDIYRWVYLSDGGHFENLALYEMVLRRCRYIVVSDGGCDPKFTFDDLGNAIRKIRMDFGIPIEFDKMSMRARDEDSPWSYVAVGKIHYDVVDGKRAKPGILIYLKPGYYADDRLPKDVVNYAKECPDFPHETTADQWFSESQFESYRALGRHVMEQITGPADDTLAAFTGDVEGQLKSQKAVEYVPVVAERITVKGARTPKTAVVLPTTPRRLQDE